MKKSSVALATFIALFCVWHAFLSPGAVWIDPLTGINRVPLLWPLVQAALAGVTVVALLSDFILVAALCAFIVLALSLITFFSFGLYLLIPAAILVVLIALHYGRKPLSRA